MEIIPVIDIMKGIAVSGKSGKREEYTALKTVFANSSNPVEIAKNLPFKRLYVAELDGIMEGVPNIEMLEELSGIRRLMVDVGIKNLSDYNRISHLNADIIVGSETLQDFETLETITEECRRLIFSIDIKDGKVMSPFPPSDPVDAFELLADKVKKFIILNISSVGTLSTDFSLLEKFKVRDVEIYYGGGIKKEGIEKMKKMGIVGVLVGTALHKGFFEKY
jgi:phosphoribosylformimino-5-aminoimidazole carboxamide ribotide isomerase